MSIHSMNKKIQRTTTKAIFNRDNKILFVKDPKGVWELPGGRIEHGENPKEALKREIEEELGWKDVKVNNIIDSWSFQSQANNTDYHFIILTYACTSDEKVIKEDDEYTEYKWIPIPEVEKFNMRDGYKETIKKLNF